MKPEIEAAAEQAALEARCERCRTFVVMDASAAGTILGRLIIPGAGKKHSFQLCGKCGLQLREFLMPELEFDRVFQEAKAALMEHWA